MKAGNHSLNLIEGRKTMLWISTSLLPNFLHGYILISFIRTIIFILHHLKSNTKLKKNCSIQNLNKSHQFLNFRFHELTLESKPDSFCGTEGV